MNVYDYPEQQNYPFLIHQRYRVTFCNQLFSFYHRDQLSIPLLPNTKFGFQYSCMILYDPVWSCTCMIATFTLSSVIPISRLTFFTISWTYDLIPLQTSSEQEQTSIKTLNIKLHVLFFSSIFKNRTYLLDQVCTLVVDPVCSHKRNHLEFDPQRNYSADSSRLDIFKY